LIYLLFGLHIAHWKLNGSTLAPLELNEVMYTLEAGVVTAGFLLMATLMLATAVVGRFFCSWACHILALEDLCSWLLSKARIRTHPVRSRLLLVVPPLALLYMFVWPQLLRLIEGHPLPRLRILGDEEGWASFVTSDFWRNLPSPWIAGLTFFVCGFAVVYVLGSRSFCMHACPYGAAFALMDRVAPGRIKLTGDCEQCGICTSVCSSQVRVHEEVARFGKVVDANCMKDLDCVSACPQGALSFGFTKPAALDSFSKTGRRRLKYAFSLGEEALMVVAFLTVLLVFRGLYLAIPFLMTLGLGGIAAYLAVNCWWLVERPNVRLLRFRLKHSGSLTAHGRDFVLAMVILGLFTVHSGFVRYHEVRGQHAFETARLELEKADAVFPNRAVGEAIHHLGAARRWGLIHPLARDHQLASLLLKSEEPDRAEPYLTRIARDEPTDRDSRLALAQLLLRTGRVEQAADEARAVIAGFEQNVESPGADASIGPTDAFMILAEAHVKRGESEHAITAYRSAAVSDASNITVRMLLAQLLTSNERYEEAGDIYRDVISMSPDLVTAHYNLAVILAGSGDSDRAIESYERVLALNPEDVQTLVNLGFLRARRGGLAEAADYFRRAVELQPDHAQAHFNLATIRSKLGQSEQAGNHYRRAAELDPGYAEKMRTLN